jgi:hypothetical protein
VTGRRASEDPAFELSPLGCLAFLWPAIPEAMVAPDERRWIERMAAQLPAVPRLALEMRLEGEASGADLHQFISAAKADARILERYLRRGETGPISGTPLREFLLDWAGNAGGLRDDIDGFYLEWDRPEGDGAPAEPAIFLPLEGSDGKERQHGGRERALDRAERLRTGAGEAVRAGLEAVEEHLPEGVSINYLGFMVGRGTAFRVNLRGIRPDALPALLTAIAWPGDIGVAARHFGRLVERADRVIVALDLAPRLQASIGFETVLEASPAQEPRWAALFDYLCAEGLCAADKREALEALPACLYPEQSDQTWPASWLVGAVLSPPHCVPWLERRISHLKLSIAGDGRVAAKAYVSAQHFWSRHAIPPAKRPTLPGSSTSRLERARAAAISFLLAACGQDDLWRDFRLPNGASDEWVTAFVGWALLRGGDPGISDRVRRSLEALLRRQRPAGGWGYNGFSPPDSDSTAWAAKFLDAAGYRGPAAEKAEGFLRAHLLPGDGFSTYAPSTPIRFVGDAPAGGGSGWRRSHLCVAANAAARLHGALSAHLRGAQSPDGSWSAYWWKDDAFSTALAVEALAGDASATGHRARAIAWARDQSPGTGSAFHQAWLAHILMTGSAADQRLAGEAAIALAEEQRADGSWASGAAMLFPAPSQAARDPSGAAVLDDRRVFTTASVLVALECARKATRG